MSRSASETDRDSLVKHCILSLTCMSAASSFLEIKSSALKKATKRKLMKTEIQLFVVPKFHPGDCLPEKTLGTFVLAASPKRKNGRGGETGESSCFRFFQIRVKFASCCSFVPRSQYLDRTSEGNMKMQSKNKPSAST